MNNLVTCPCCNGDGKETCHNPDHGFISMMSWHDIGRLGCPVCGHHDHHKVGSKKPGGSDPCEECDGAGQVTEEKAQAFCNGLGYDYEEIMERTPLAAPQNQQQGE